MSNLSLVSGGTPQPSQLCRRNRHQLRLLISTTRAWSWPTLHDALRQSALNCSSLRRHARAKWPEPPLDVRYFGAGHIRVATSARNHRDAHHQRSMTQARIACFGRREKRFSPKHSIYLQQQAGRQKTVLDSFTTSQPSTGLHNDFGDQSVCAIQKQNGSLRAHRAQQ